jgi:hypothetical protein
MKRILLISMCVVLAMTIEFAHAQEKAPLGKGHFALKLAYIAFTDSYFDEGSEDDGIYIGIEGFGRIAPNWYFGGEIGSAVNITIISGEEISFIPIELNVKYAKEVARNLVIDFGAGVAACYAKLVYQDMSSSDEESRDDWLFGGQVFADLTYNIRRFSIGVHGKYQITNEFNGEDIALSNYRIGIHMGFTF